MVAKSPMRHLRTSSRLRVYPETYTFCEENKDVLKSRKSYLITFRETFFFSPMDTFQSRQILRLR